MSLLSYLDFQLKFKDTAEFNTILTIVENMAEDMEDDYESYLMKNIVLEEEGYVVEFTYGYEELESITVSRRGDNL